MFKTLWQGITGQTYQWNQSKWRVQTQALKNADRWVSVAISIFGIDRSEAIVTRNALIAGLDSTLQFSPSLLDSVERDFGRRIIGDFLIRDWFFVLQCGAFLLITAERRGAGLDSNWEPEIVATVFHGLGYVYEKDIPNDIAPWLRVFEQPDLQSHLFPFVARQLGDLFGARHVPANIQQHLSCIVDIAGRTLILNGEAGFSSRADSWIQQANAGTIGR